MRTISAAKVDFVIPASAGKLSPRPAETNAPSPPAGTTAFIALGWHAALNENGLTAFERFWKLDGADVDAPNFARGGWSRVSRCELSSGRRTVYVKRQLQYQTKTWRHPLRGQPTLQREFRNLEHCRRHEVPTPSVIYFATATIAGKPAAVLVTEALVDFERLDVRLQSLSHDDTAIREKVLMAVARTLARLHRSGLTHGCFYPKHILVPRARAHAEQLRFIDLEKARPHFFARAALRRDFGTLSRRLPMCTPAELNLFLAAYESEPSTRHD